MPVVALCRKCHNVMCCLAVAYLWRYQCISICSLHAKTALSTYLLNSDLGYWGAAYGESSVWFALCFIGFLDSDISLSFLRFVLAVKNGFHLNCRYSIDHNLLPTTERLTSFVSSMISQVGYVVSYFHSNDATPRY